LQKVGAFKARGALNAVRLFKESMSNVSSKEVPCVITHSSGNHAAALARAAQLEGLKAIVVMPKNAPRNKKQAVLGYQARVVECEPTMASREAITSQLIGETGAHLIHPYDDPAVIAGQGTAAIEFMEQVPALDALLVPVGGGGLISGTVLAVESMNQATAVFGAEPDQARDAYDGFKSGIRQVGRVANTLADGLRGELSARTFALIRHGVKDIGCVQESEIIEAMRLILNTLKLVIEPSAAVAFAALLNGSIRVQGRVGVILSGGNIDPLVWPALAD
jgi:threonine dehydratase